MSLRVQLQLLQALIVCLAVLTTGIIAATLQERSIRDAYQDRMIAVAQSVAALPAITAAFETADPSVTIQPIAEVIREASDVTYVVVTDDEGIRMSHPDPERIGEMVSTDPSAPLSGDTWVGTQEGTLGVSWRVKIPIFAEDEQTVIGTVSVGILESQLSAEFLSQVPPLLGAMAASAVIGVFGAAWVTAVVRRRIFRLEPAEIATLVEQRETMLHRIGEGIITVDHSGVITVVNDAAARLLGTSEAQLLGARAEDVLEPALLAVLQRIETDGALVLVGERVLIARSTGTTDEGKPTAATLLLRDHTELHRAMREMDGAQSLTDGLRAQAHEFANKMHVVSALLELGLVDEARAFIAESAPGGAMEDGIHAFLGDLELSALLSVKRSQARELGISLEIRDDTQLGELPEAAGRDLLTIVGNLVDNALEACGVGDTVRVAAEREGRMLRLTVSDDGPGIPPELREEVFVEGVSTKASGSSIRRGIGLALVRRIVRRRRGRVAIDESPQGGARFTVELPIPVAPEVPV